MARQEPKIGFGKRASKESVPELIKNHLITFGLNEMAEPVQNLERWLVEKPSERVTIVCPERLPAERAEQLLSAVGVESKIVDRNDNLSDVSAYVLTIPPLCERLQDLPLITEFIVAEHLRIYPGDFMGVHPSILPLCYYLCHKYDSTNGLTPPLLTEDNYVGFLRKAIIEKIIGVSVFDRVKFKCQLDGYEETRSCLQPFKLLEDEFVDLPNDSTFENSRRGWAPGETETEISLRSDPSTMMIIGACAHLRSIASEEFSFFFHNSKLSKKDREATELIKPDKLQKIMIGIGAKCIRLLASMKVTPIQDIYDLYQESLSLWSKPASCDILVIVLKFSQDFRSININRLNFEATSKQASVLSLLFDNWEANTPAVAQGTILQEVYSESTHTSLRKAFDNNTLYDLLVEPGDRKGTVRFQKSFKIEVVNRNKSLEG